MSKPFRIYMSHCIRGAKGNDATDEDMARNNQLAINIGKELRSHFFDWEKMDGFPEINIYVPADHDEFVCIAYRKGYLTETEILDVDCDIVSTCDMLVVYGTYISHGMKVEMKYAAEHNMPIYNLPDLSEIAVQGLKFSIDLILKSRGE